MFLFSASGASTPITRTSARNISRTTIPNSSDNDDDDIINVNASLTTSNRRRLLHSVVVNNMPPKAKATPASRRVSEARRAAEGSASSRSSFASSTRDNSVGYDTPMTSAAATPAGGSFLGRKSFTLGGLSMDASNKRKRASNLAKSTGFGDDTSMDAQLALRLQAEEWEDHEAGPSNAAEEFTIPDSDDAAEVSVCYNLSSN